MIELPRAALLADKIAEVADFFSFGTNDLTQTVFGLSRDDAGKFLPHYVDLGILAKDPFVSIDVEGVGEMVRIAVEKGRAAKNGLKLGICGEHGGDPASIAFCEAGWIGLCIVFPVPGAGGAPGGGASGIRGEWGSDGVTDTSLRDPIVAGGRAGAWMQIPLRGPGSSFPIPETWSCWDSWIGSCGGARFHESRRSQSEVRPRSFRARRWRGGACGMTAGWFPQGFVRARHERASPRRKLREICALRDLRDSWNRAPPHEPIPEIRLARSR